MLRNKQDMLHGPLLGSIIRYSIPIILTSLLQLFFNAADLVIVGRFCGSVSIGAVGATGPLTGLMVNFFLGFSLGSGVSVAHSIGSREDNVTHKTVHTAIPLAVVCGAILTVIGVCCSEAMLELMGTPENVLPLSAVYMKIYFSGMIFNILYNVCASILRAAGDTKSPLIFLLISGVLNVVLNIFFVTVFHMDVAGVAWATVISQAVSAVLVVIVLMRRTDACKLIISKLRFYTPQLMKIIRLGLPAGIQNSLFAISNVLIQSFINSFGDVFMAGNAAASNIEGFIYVSMMAFYQTAVNYVGQNVGANQYERVKKIFWTCMGCVTCVGLVLGVSAWLFGRQLLPIYITDSPQAIEYGMIRMTYLALPYFVCGIMDVSTGTLRGMGYSFVPMLVSIFGVCGVRIGWLLTVFQIPQFHTPSCLYLSYLVSWTVTLIGQITLFMIVYKKKVRELSADNQK